MQISVITFQFAHNYGAALQAYAMKCFLEKKGEGVKFINYEPASVIPVYSLNPFVNGFRFKTIMRNILRLPHRIPQYHIFKTFICDELGCNGRIIIEENDLRKILENEKIVIYGSDQIWNEKITGETFVYYGKYTSSETKRIAYAASLGTTEMTQFQRDSVREWLPHFHAISVREKDLISDISDTCFQKVEHVIDPVFLLPHSFWVDFARKPKGEMHSNYILYYALRNDDELIRRTELLGQSNNMVIYCIHPTAIPQKIGGTQLYQVGPREFVWLVLNAQYICTNSFHASAFSVLFNKNLVHCPYQGSGGRVESLLSLVVKNNTIKVDEKGNQWFDLKNIDNERLEQHIEESKAFLTDSVFEGIEKG